MRLFKTDLYIKKKDFFLIPNILCYCRLAMVPVFIVVYMNAKTLTGTLWAAAIVLLSAMTDVADGIIARHFGMISDLGKILDPIADKAMQFSMLFCVTVKYPGLVLLIVIYAVKEVVSGIFSGYLLTKGKHIDGAMWAGKVCTVILFIVMLVFIAVPKIPHDIVSTLIGFAAGFMVIAFIVYMRAYFRLWKEVIRETEDTHHDPLDM